MTKVGDESITYDFIGNPLTYRGATCSWERLNLLKSFTKDGETATFVYDKDKQLSKKTVGEEETEYVWFDGKLIREKRGEEYVDYYYSADGIQGFKHSSLGTYYYRKNLFGDITEIVDGNGTVKGKYSYTGYGECSIITDENGIASINPFRYRGYYYEKSTGLYYLKSRYYDAEVGRFITFDALENLDPEHIDGLNLYVYCNNNPIMFTDETGEMPKWLRRTFKFVAAVAIVVGVTAIAVATAGAAAAVLGASVTAVTTSTAVGGLVAGGVEIASQIYRNGIDNMNYTSILLETASGAVNGVLSGVMTSTVSPVARVGARVGKVLLGGATEVLHGINNGQSFKQTMVKAGKYMLGGALIQAAFIGKDAYAGKFSKDFLGETEFGTGDMLKLSGSLFGRKLYKTSLYAKDVVNKGWDIVKGWF